MYCNPRKIRRIKRIEYKELWQFYLSEMHKAIDNANADLAGENAKKAFHNFKLGFIR